MDDTFLMIVKKLLNELVLTVDLDQKKKTLVTSWSEEPSKRVAWYSLLTGLFEHLY